VALAAITTTATEQEEGMCDSTNDGRLAEALRLATECRALLEFVKNLSDPAALQECKAQATAVMEYIAQRRDLSVEDHNAAVKIKARVVHRLGEVLAATVNHAGNRGPGNAVLPRTLPEKITKMQSSRAQQLASISWEKALMCHRCD
jgi:hypothetical protein